ncbi:MAG: hypothetical protein ACOX2O_09715 [Bdellovibrionota bacterium]
MTSELNALSDREARLKLLEERRHQEKRFLRNLDNWFKRIEQGRKKNAKRARSKGKNTKHKPLALSQKMQDRLVELLEEPSKGWYTEIRKILANPSRLEIFAAALDPKKFPTLYEKIKKSSLWNANSGESTEENGLNYHKIHSCVISNAERWSRHLLGSIPSGKRCDFMCLLVVEWKHYYLDVLSSLLRKYENPNTKALIERALARTRSSLLS